MSAQILLSNQRKEVDLYLTNKIICDINSQYP